MGYLQSIYKIYVCVVYVSGMYRVCVGYLSEKYREIGERLEGRGWLLAIGYWLWAIGDRLLEIGYWRLAIGYGLLEIGYWRWVRGETIDS